MTGKTAARAAVTDGMRDTSKDRGPDVVKCSKTNCNRPTSGGYKMCARCRSYHRDYQRRQTAGSKVAKVYFEPLFAKGPAK